MRQILLFSLLSALAIAQKPSGYSLPNGWRISPVGKSIPTEDMLLHLLPSPDGKVVVALHGGFNPHGLVTIDAKTDEVIQRIPLKSAWLGMAWSPDGKRLFVSGGNANGRKESLAPIYVFDYADRKLTQSGAFNHILDKSQVYWSGLAHHPSRDILYAANRGTTAAPSHVVVFDSASGQLKKSIDVEVSPYDLVLGEDGKFLYVSNWGSDSVSVIDTATEQTVATIAVGDNPNDMELAPDGRLFVSCANDNTIVVIDTKSRQAVERISTALTPRSPEGSTPNGLAIDREANVLFVANADNNSVAVVSIKHTGKSEVLGFIPSGWYPSALALAGMKTKLYVGNSKGMGGYSNIRGPHSPLPAGEEGKGSVKSLQKGSITIVPLQSMKASIQNWTKQVYENVPYKDEFLTRSKAPSAPTVLPRDVGAGSAVKHVIYIIKENRTYDQVLGDMPKGNGDPRLTIFGRDVTPNQHALAEQFVLLDNLFCDGEVSVDGHAWSVGAYATDFNEKLWPPNYGGHSKAAPSNAYLPGAGHLWDLARRKGLTYRSYGEYATRASDGSTMEASPAVGGLFGHVAPRYKLPGMRDTDNAREFIREFDEYEANIESKDANKRLPNLVVMSLPENHTVGTRPGGFTPRAAVANNDYALGMIIERVSHSKYWPQTAIFVIEDDAQDGPDHVDARRTTGFIASPYTKRGSLDSTLYTTSSMLRSIELLLGLPPMSQYDAAATPMYASFTDKPDATPFTKIEPKIDVNAKNAVTAWGAKESMEMDLDEIDRAPMLAFNEIIWKSVRGPDSKMPLPIHRFHFQSR